MDASDPVAGLPPLRDVIARLGLSARRGLGQNFLLDLNLTRRIARSAGPLDDGTIVEIGPGPGGLTRALLLEGARRVVAVEIDARCIAALEDLRQAAGDRLEIVAGDALAIDLAALGPPPRRVVANLPYNIGTPLLLRWMERPQDCAGYTLMFQKEVAARLVAAPGSQAYGRLSVAVQWRHEARLLLDVPPRAFVPPPKVTSSVVQIVPRAAPLAAADPDFLQAVTAAAFGQRRKMLRSSLRAVSARPMELLAAATIAGTARAETLSVEEFCALARALEQQVCAG